MLKFPSKPDGRAAHSCRSPYPDFGMTSSGLRPLPGRLAAVRFRTFRTMFEPEPNPMFRVQVQQITEPEPEQRFGFSVSVNLNLNKGSGSVLV